MLLPAALCFLLCYSAAALSAGGSKAGAATAAIYSCGGTAALLVGV